MKKETSRALTDFERTVVVKDLPKHFDWFTLKSKQARGLSNSLTQIFIARRDHGPDVRVVYGFIDPINNYRSFNVYEIQWHSEKKEVFYRLIPKDEIYAISLVPSFYAHYSLMDQ